MKIKTPNFKNHRKILNYQSLVLLIIFLIYCIYFAYFSIKRYQTLNSHYYDLGIMNQVVYNTAKGRILQMTNPTFLKNMSRLAIHFDPILIFFAPIYWFFNSPASLLIAQTILVAVGGLAVYKLSFLIIKKKTISFLFFILYFLNYQIARSLLFDFHPIVLAIPILLWAIYFYHKKFFLFYYLLIFLALLTKEHVGLFLFFLGLFYFFIFKDKKNGFVTFSLGLLSFLVINFLIIPYFRSQSHFALSYYSNIKNNFFIDKDKVDYLIRLYLPFIFSFFSPAIILTLPEFLINYLSKNINMRLYYFHYQSLIMVGLFYSLILGYKKFDNFFKKPKLKKIMFLIFLFFNFYFFYLYYPLPFFVKEKIYYSKIPLETQQVINLWQKTLKNEKIKIATTPKLAPFFTAREFYVNFLFDPAFYSLGYSDDEIFQLKKDGYKNVDYIIIFRKEIGDLTKENAVKKMYNNFLKDKNFQLIFNHADIEVYKKI